MDDDKIETLTNWSSKKIMENGRLNNLFEIQEDPSLCNSYRPFIAKFLDQVEPLT